MPGPAPKDPRTRQRRNRAATRARLEATEDQMGSSRPPRLPAIRTWHEMTRAWWKDVWASPMAAEYLFADRHGLFRLALLVDDFWNVPPGSSQALRYAAEIRMQGQLFGLTPIDRRRLQWEVDRAESREPSRGRDTSQPDPRLKVVP